MCATLTVGPNALLPPYVKNKAGLTGQTVPGRRIPGHWPYPGPEELAETEPCVPGLIDVPFFVSFNTPYERVLGQARPAYGRANFSMSRLRVCRLSCSVLQPARATAKHAHSPRPKPQKGCERHGLNETSRYGDRDDGRK